MKKEHLEFDGERYTTQLDQEGILSQISLNRYSFALNYCYDKRVLDIACGCGYGTNILSRNATSVDGADIDERTIEFCKEKYKKNNIRFFRIDANEELPLPTDYYDVVTCFETIEHLKEYELFIREIHRVLKPNGLLFLSTPNKELSDGKGDYHYKEFNFKEINNLLLPYFSIENYYQGNQKQISNSNKLLKRIIQKLLYLDKYNIRYKSLPKRFRLSMANKIDDCDCNYEIKKYEKGINPKIFFLIGRCKRGGLDGRRF